MERIQTSLTGINSTILQLGFEGEQNHTRVVIYCTQIFNEYPDAVASMVIKPPTGDVYPKVLIRDGMKVIWDASAADCAIPGNGQYQLTFTNGDEIIKTYIGEYTVLRSLIGSGDPPDPVEDWLQEAQAALAAFDQDVSDAEAWAIGRRDGEPVESTDLAYHNNSKYYAEQAEEVLESIPPDYTELSEEVDALADEVSDLNSAFILNMETIPDTIQTIAFDSSGNVQSITHTRDNVAVRTDVFTFGANTITEVRTLSTGESLTIVTNTDTLETTTTYADAA